METKHGQEIEAIASWWRGRGNRSRDIVYHARKLDESHSALLAALKGLVACCIVAEHPEDREIFFRAQEQAKAAIALASE